MQVLEHLNAGEFEDVSTILGGAESRSSPYLGALLAEAQVWDCLQRGNERPSKVHAEAAEKALADLLAVWNGYLGGEAAVADVVDAVPAYRERVQRIERRVG